MLLNVSSSVIAFVYDCRKNLTVLNFKVSDWAHDDVGIHGVIRNSLRLGRPSSSAASLPTSPSQPLMMVLLRRSAPLRRITGGISAEFARYRRRQLHRFGLSGEPSCRTSPRLEHARIVKLESRALSSARNRREFRPPPRDGLVPSIRFPRRAAYAAIGRSARMHPKPTPP